MNLCVWHAESDSVCIALGCTIAIYCVASASLDGPSETIDTHAAVINAIRVYANLIITVHDDGSVLVHERYSRRCVVRRSMDDSVWGLSLSLSFGSGICNAQLATSANDHRIAVFDLQQAEPEANHPELQVLEGHRHNIPCLDFTNSDAPILASGSIDSTVRLHERVGGEWGFVGELGMPNW